MGVVVLDVANGTAPSFNREARRVMEGLLDPDQAPDELLDLVTVHRGDGREFSLAEFPLSQVLGSGETVRAEEIVLGVPDGRSVSVLLNATPIRSGEGAVESVVVTMQDLAPLKEQERLRAEFLGMVSHELRMPLSAIRGAATTLLDAAADLDPAETRQFHRIIVDRTDHMRELIGDLLDLARIETGALSVDPEPTEVAALADRARNTFISSGGRHQLEIDVAPGLPMVLADRRRVVQVVGNLLSNAARHSPEDSVIRVSATLEGAYVETSVSDRGRGIPAEDLPGLFGKFSRRGDQDAGGDTGLGLAICRGIVEAHGGRIRAESDGVGLGTRFAFTLPAVPDTAPDRSAADARDERPSDGPPEGTVLVVDDDPRALREVRNALAPAGFHAVSAADSREALLLMAEHRPRLALLDLMLPGGDGVELMGDLLAISQIPVIFVSAYGRDEVVANALEQGATDYIVKPFSPTELVARVGAALRRYKEPERPEPAEPLALGELVIDFAHRRASLAGSVVTLTPTEYDLLAELAADAGRVVPTERLLRRVWSPAKPGNPKVLRTHLVRLRRKLGEDASNPRYIFNEPRVGYRLGPAEAEP